MATSYASLPLRMSTTRPSDSAPCDDYAYTGRTICVQHANYEDAASSVFLRMNAVDVGSGLGYSVLHTACAMIANNAWRGRLQGLVHTPQRQWIPIRHAADSTVSAGTYRFVVPGFTEDDPYPLVPSFREWRFPHESLPPLWGIPHLPLNPVVEGESQFNVSNFSLNVTRRDSFCRMSGCKEGLDAAHLCPRAEVEWFARNGMASYARETGLPPHRVISNTENGVALRADLHRLFDQNEFVFVSKPDTASSDLDASNAPKMAIVTHILQPSNELGSLYHNRKLHGETPVVEFLIARFAWAIFQLHEKTFWSASKPKRLAYVDGRKMPWNIKISPSKTSKIRKMNDGQDCGEATGEPSLTQSVTSDSAQQTRKRPKHEAEMGAQGQAYGEQGRRIHHSSASSDPYNIFPKGKALPSSQKPMDISNECHSGVPSEIRERCEEIRAHGRLKLAWLERERERSDPDHTWAARQEWIDRVWDNEISLDSKQMATFSALTEGYSDGGEEISSSKSAAISLDLQDPK